MSFLPDRPVWVGLTSGNFDLHRQGEADRGKFKRRVDEVVRGNLPGIVSDEVIITSDGNRVVRVPIRGLQIPHFRFGNNQRGGVGQGAGEPGEQVEQVGQGAGEQGPGQGKEAGNTPGEDYLEVQYTVDQLAELIFEDLGLPFPKPKPQHEELSEDVRFNDIRKKGPMGNLDKRRTILENLTRNAKAGQPGFGGISNDDLRFKTWERHVEPRSNAVILAMRDVSGSMGEFEKYISRVLFFWSTRFLRSKYDKAEIVFITHHAEAKEVDENTFFSLGESGGTRVSSAYQLAADVMKERYPSALWDRYPMHASDGDNCGETDNRRCLQLIQEMLKGGCNAFGYFEIRQGGYSSLSTLMSSYQAFPDPHLIRATIEAREDVLPALKAFFDPTKKDKV